MSSLSQSARDTSHLTACQRCRAHLRTARRNWKRRQRLTAVPHADKTVITLTDLEWAGRGWRTTGDAVLALSAAAQAREHRHVAREEAPAA